MCWLSSREGSCSNLRPYPSQSSTTVSILLPQVPPFLLQHPLLLPSLVLFLSLPWMTYLKLRSPRFIMFPRLLGQPGHRLLAMCCKSSFLTPLSPLLGVSFFMLPKCILVNPPRGGHSHWRDTQNIILSRLASWKAGEYSDLWAKASTREPQSRRKPKCLPVPDGSQDALSSSNARRARCAAGDGHYRRLFKHFLPLG